MLPKKPLNRKASGPPPPIDPAWNKKSKENIKLLSSHKYAVKPSTNR